MRIAGPSRVACPFRWQLLAARLLEPLRARPCLRRAPESGYEPGGTGGVGQAIALPFDLSGFPLACAKPLSRSTLITELRPAASHLIMPVTVPTESQVSRTLWSAYREAPMPQRMLAALRPFICPLGPILSTMDRVERVLDIGCGNGLFLTTLSTYARIDNGWGIDVNGGALRSAAQVAASNALPLRFSRVGSIDEWPDEQFDVVSMVDVMHHVPHELRRRFIHQAVARVKPGGAFLYKDMCSGPWWRVGWNACHDLILARQLVKVEPVANVIAWADEAGFQSVHRQSYVASVVYGHELVLFRRKAATSCTDRLPS